MKKCVMASPTDRCLEYQEAFSVLPQEWMRQPELAENYFATEPMLAIPSAWTQQSEVLESCFATEPMPAIRSRWTQPRELEEACHTSFEEAISERAARVSQKLRRLSTTAVPQAFPQALFSPTASLPVTDALPVPSRALLAGVSRFWRERKRTIVLACLGFCLFLLGFDLMGLLSALH